MKKILYMITLVWIGIGMTGCEKKVKEYDGEEGVYFYVQRGDPGWDTTVWANEFFTPVEFVKIQGDETDVKVRVMTTGRTKDYDRRFRMVVDEDSTTAVLDLNYTYFDEYQVIKAGHIFADVNIHLKRNDNIKQEKKVLSLRLLPSDDFTIGIPVWHYLSGMRPSAERSDFDGTEHKIIMNDFIVRPERWPERWPDVVEPGVEESGRWGIFTEKKFNLICHEFGLKYEDFTSKTTMPTVKQTVIQDYMVRYLQKLYDNKKPELEDDGRLMWFEGVTWKSKVGVPWVPAQ